MVNAKSQNNTHHVVLERQCQIHCITLYLTDWTPLPTSLNLSNLSNHLDFLVLQDFPALHDFPCFQTSWSYREVVVPSSLLIFIKQNLCTFLESRMTKINFKRTLKLQNFSFLVAFRKFGSIKDILKKWDKNHLEVVLQLKTIQP